MKEFCVIHEGNPDKPVLYFLHGYSSDKDKFLHFTRYFNRKGYTTYACDARGHGDREQESKINDFIGTIDDYNALINENKKDAVLIGISMGGAEALKIGNENKHVKGVFAISAPYDDSEFDDPRFLKMMERRYDYPIQRDVMQKVVPKYYTPNKKTDFYLIHDKNDGMVPFEQFEKNKKHFNLSDDDTLVYDHIIDAKNPLLHVYPIFRKKTQQWINEKII